MEEDRGTNIIQGEVVVGDIVHRAAINCMVIPADDPEGWYFKQFVSMEHVKDFAREYNLVIKEKE